MFVCIQITWYFSGAADGRIRKESTDWSMSSKLIHHDKDQDTSECLLPQRWTLVPSVKTTDPFSSCLTFTTGSDKIETSVTAC